MVWPDKTAVNRQATNKSNSSQDVLAYMTFPKEHRPKLHWTNPIEDLNGEIKRRTEVVGISPNDEAILRLVGALLLEQNDVYGPLPVCKARHGACGRVSGYASRSAAGLDGVRGSAARQMDELIWLASFHGPLPNPDHTGLPSHSITLASQHWS
jgi:hypothetical protein